MSIFKCARKGDLDGLQKYTEFNVLDNAGWTPLAHAVHWGNDNCVQYLLEKGADPNILTDRDTPIIYFALWRDHPKCLQLLLNYGVDPTTYVIKYGPLLHVALNFNHTECVEILLTYKPDLRVKDSKDGYTVFHYTSNASLYLILKYADMTDQLQHIDTKNNKGETPLMIASSRCKTTTVRLLLHYGANPYIKDNNENTAKDLAVKEGHQSIVDLIESYEILSNM